MAVDRHPIKRALLSVSNKEGIGAFGRFLHEMGVELISTGGTAGSLREAGVPVTDIGTLTGNPEAFGGRMKTLSFEVESALLFHRERDAKEAKALNINPIDIVVCNLYPFKAVRDRGGDYNELVENIDIGGPTMIRAGAKNYEYVAVVCDPADYTPLIEELKENEGTLSLDTRHRLMRKAYCHTADYDKVIAQALSDAAGEPTVRMSFANPLPLRYGENPHQAAHFFPKEEDAAGLSGIEILGGKALSFNNIMDLAGALEAVADLDDFGCAVIKHTNPCGLAQSKQQDNLLELAWEGDPMSAFGSIIAFNKPVDAPALRFLNLDHPKKMQRKFVEVVVAPDFTEEALAYLKNHESLRIVKIDPKTLDDPWDYKFVHGALLAQRRDADLLGTVEVVTEVAPQPLDEGLMRFGLQAVRQLKSNAICIVRRRADGAFQLLGMGAGQPNRVTSTRLAVEKAYENLTREAEALGKDVEAHMKAQLKAAVLVSDAFFPFPDNIDMVAEAGIGTVFQPGGSIRDKKVIKACNHHGIAMVMTGNRHFKH